ncbi:MAG: GNAT family N-acetyltransferase [Anaerolineae bacterium]|nr:GNAT family N-acetyltransferase [Anaerolineae bacterium]
MTVDTRRATPQDAGAISGIWAIICAERDTTAVNRPFTAQQEADYIAALSEREGVFVAEADGEMVGFQTLDLWAKYTDSFDHVGVVGTFVLPGQRRAGIGQRLAAHTLAFARAHGYEKLVIYVRARNTRAQAFYRSLGFAPKGILERQVKLDGAYDDEVFMELFL